MSNLNNPDLDDLFGEFGLKDVAMPLSYPELKKQISKMFPGAIFSSPKREFFVPAKCRSGRWYRTEFYDGTQYLGIVVWSQKNAIWESEDLRNLMKSNGFRNYRNPKDDCFQDL